MWNNATVITGKVRDIVVKIMLDTGSAVSLLHCREANYVNSQPSLQGCSSIQLVTASEESLPIISCVKGPIKMTNDFVAKHKFLIMDSLIYPVILGTDFLYKHHLCLSTQVTIQCNTSDLGSVQPLWDATEEAKAKQYVTAAIGAILDHDIVEECSILCYDKPITYDVPPCSNITIGEVLSEYKYLFTGVTTLVYYHIPTTENPYKYCHEEFLPITTKRLNSKSMTYYNKAS